MEIFSLYPQIHILIVDDNSHDGTKDALMVLKSKFRNLITINRSRRLGLGSAYREGFFYAFSNKFSFVIQMDGDRSHRVEDLKTCRGGRRVRLSSWIKICKRR